MRAFSRATHEEVEGKLLKLYKRHTTALESDIALHKSVFAARSVALGKKDRADTMVTLDELRSWYAEARSQWVLATRALDTRVRHHNAFYGGGDAGHLQYLNFLRTLILELEDFMQGCDELGYELLLHKECAKWVQNAPPSTITGSAGCGMETAAASGLDAGSDLCIEPDRAPSGTQGPLTPPPSPSSRRRKSKVKSKSKQLTQEEASGCSSTSCPDELVCRDSQKRNAVVQRLCVFLEPELGNDTSCRAEVFATFFRRAIARSPSLFMRVRTWEHEPNNTAPWTPSCTTCIQQPSACVVANFIRSNALSQSELERLVKKLPFVRGESMSAELIRGAVADTFRYGGTTDENCIPILGGWVFEKPWVGPMPVVAWDAMHQLVACAGCALGASRSIEEALQVRRFAFVGGCHEDALRLGVSVPACLPDGAVPRFPRWQDQCSPPEIAMRILSVWLAADNRKTKRFELKKFTPKVHGMKPTYSEHEERHWIYMRMRWPDSRLLSFVTALNASDKYTVLAQRTTKPGPTQVHVPSKESDAWVSRVRSGATPVARRSARWTTSTVFRMEIFEYFHKRSPEAKAGLTYLDETDILDVVVMDNDNGDWSPFLQSVGDVLLSACGYSSLDAMLAGELTTDKQSVN